MAEKPPAADKPAEAPKPPTPSKASEDSGTDDDVLQEILEELKSKVDDGVFGSIAKLPINQQIKILRSVVKGSKAQAKAEKKTKTEDEADPEEKPDTRKRVTVKKIAPADTGESSPETKEDTIVKLGERFATREEWLDNFLTSDKLYYKGKFSKHDQ